MIMSLSKQLMTYKGQATVTLQEFIEKGDIFEIPDYQRGYVWGQIKELHKDSFVKDAVTYLTECIKDGFKDGEKDIFLQGITVSQEEGRVIIVDGQQRTTFFYLLLSYLDGTKPFKIKYTIREESDNYLEQLCSDRNFRVLVEDENDLYQDIYFFKKTIRIFEEMFKGEDKSKLKDYVLKHVRFLYIVIPSDKASIQFTMMNGNKAIMKQEELIKAELLRCSASNTEKIIEAENVFIRARFAREWDKWLYWWNKKEVQQFFKIESQLGWLLPLVSGSEYVSFQLFKEVKLKNGDSKTAKDIFREIRLLQRCLEDAYDDAITYNLLGAILCIRQNSERYSLLEWYWKQCREEEHQKATQLLKRYFDLAFIGMTHKEIIEFNNGGEDYDEKYQEKRQIFRARLSSDQLYNSDYEIAVRWLLRRNILEDCTQSYRLGRKFNFFIWRNRSLEHIYPKSKVIHKDGDITLDYNDQPLVDFPDTMLWREDIKSQEYTASEHSIGNLVLLYGRENSKFNNSDFEEKKRLFFASLSDYDFQSRHLLHTVSVFSQSEWTGRIIAEHKQEEIAIFEKDYPESYEDKKW